MRRVVIVGTADTKAAEIGFLHALLSPHLPGLATVDLGSRTPGRRMDVPAAEIAACHPDGGGFLAGEDRGAVVVAMGKAFAAWCAGNAGDIAGVIGIGGGGGTAMVTAGMRALPLGVPKVMVSTLASGDVAPYVDISDIVMVPAITDLAGLNRISRMVLHNAAMAFRGMVEHPPAAQVSGREAVGLTMFGVTTPCVTAIAAALQDRFDPLIFHATGTGGRAMEALAAQGLLAGFLDITTTEIADLLCGGVLACLPSRLDVVARTRLPWVGSLGALDMVNFWAPATVPDRFRDRLFYHHNANVTLMRTTAAEYTLIGHWLADKLNACTGPVRLLIPERGFSALDIEGGPFHDPEADQALIAALRDRIADPSKIIALPLHINDPTFAAQAAATFLTLKAAE
jgi:uncharacterized protein (UPF0261 family)